MKIFPSTLTKTKQRQGDVKIKTKLSAGQDDDRCLSVGAKIWGLAIGVTLGVLSHYFIYVTNFRYDSFSPADMIALGSTLGGFTSNLCQRVSIDSTSGDFDAYRLQHSAEVDRYTRNRYNTTEIYTTLNGVEKRSFYLLDGSVANVMACFEENRYLSQNVTAKALVFKGKGDFDDWVQGRDGDSAALQVHLLTTNNTCKNNTHVRFSVKAVGTANYYFAFDFSTTVHPFSVVTTHVVFMLDLVRYDLAPAELICEGQRSCDVPMDYATDQDIVMKFRHPDRQQSPIHVSSKCMKRLSFWLAMFLAVPISIATALSGCCWCIFRTSGKKTKTPPKGEKMTKDGSSLGRVSRGVDKESTTVDIDGASLTGYGTVYPKPI